MVSLSFVERFIRIWKDVFKTQMDKSPLVKCNKQTLNGLDNSETV